MGATVESSSQVYRVMQERRTGSFSLSARDDVEGWGMIIVSITIGLLALGFFLAQGGIFALVGPGMVFAAVQLVRQQWARKAGEHLRQKAREFVVAFKDYATSIKQTKPGERAATTSPIASPPEHG